MARSFPVAELFANGEIVDGIVVLMLIEYALVMFWRKKFRHGPTPGAMLTNLAAGAALLMALRAALIGSSWHIIAIWLAFALLAHVGELKMRWFRQT